MIAADEDLSSPDEEDFITPTKTTKTTQAKQNPTITRKPSEFQEEEAEAEEEEVPAILSPIKATPPHKPPPKATPTPKPLKSALDIELTESEAETDDGGDNDEQDGGQKTSAKKTQSNGKNRKLDDIFEPSPPSPLPSKKSANTGLMLQFTAPSKPAGSKVSTVGDSRADDHDKPRSPEESPDLRRRKKRKKSSSSSKKRKSSQDDMGVAGGGGAGDSDKAVSAAVSSPGNPYDAIASLDAWLNSDTAELVSRGVSIGRGHGVCRRRGRVTHASWGHVHWSYNSVSRAPYTILPLIVH